MIPRIYIDILGCAGKRVCDCGGWNQAPTSTPHVCEGLPPANMVHKSYKRQFFM